MENDTKYRKKTMGDKLELEDFRHGKYKYGPKPGELRLVKDNNMWGNADDEGKVVIPGHPRQSRR